MTRSVTALNPDGTTGAADVATLPVASGADVTTVAGGGGAASSPADEQPVARPATATTTSRTGASRR